MLPSPPLLDHLQTLLGRTLSPELPRNCPRCITHLASGIESQAGCQTPPGL